MKGIENFSRLDGVGAHLREQLEQKKYILLFAFNGTGKTRLSMAFKELGKQGDGEEETRDTLYFNAFTEDLFYWDNDLKNDAKRVLLLNHDSHFFDGFQELEMENSIGLLQARYANFDFLIDYETWEILPENKEYFSKILNDFMDNYRFNPELLPAMEEAQA
jgi:hypothetical protein